MCSYLALKKTEEACFMCRFVFSFFCEGETVFGGIISLDRFSRTPFGVLFEGVGVGVALEAASG